MREILNTQMKGIIIVLCIFAIYSCKEVKPKEEGPKRIADRELSLIPKPNSIKLYEGKTPLFPKLCVNNLPDSLLPGFNIFKENYNIQVFKWKRIYKKFFEQIPNIKDTCLVISFVQDTSLPKEAYRLHLRNDIELKYGSAKAAFYALRTLEQLVEYDMTDGLYGYFYLPWMDIDDAPRFPYRGAHLDVVRHFIPMEDIRRFVDMMSYYKLNKFHLHLTDDQGWRMEIKRYPKLQSVASRRKETLIGKLGKPERYDHSPHGGFYTQESLRQLVQYAADRQIEIIPEIEMPGHSRALLAAYPELSCSGKKFPVATKWGVFNPVLCPKPETFEFLQNVLDEVIDVFPSKYIHIGGDECPVTSWVNSPFCKDLMKQDSMQDPREIEGYFIGKIAQYLKKKGKTIIGWDEILDSPVPPDATVMAWRGVDRGIIAAKMGHRTIMTPGKYCYLDHYQSLSENEPLAIGGYTPLEKVYFFDPAPDSLTPSIIEKIIGLQANIWTEYLKDMDAVSYMAFPRLLAIAEVAWTEKENKDYSQFVQSVVRHLPHLRLKRMLYSEAFKVPSYTTKNDKSYTYISLHSPFKTGRLKYWANRENSERLGEVYTAPVVLTDSMYVKVKYFSTDRNASVEYRLDFAEHAATGNHLILKTQPDLSEKNSDADYLLNGIVGKPGKWRYNQEWLEFGEEGFDGTIDMGDTLSHQRIFWHFAYEPRRRVYPPSKIMISIGNDTIHLRPLANITMKKLRKDRQIIYELRLPDIPYRFIHLEALPAKSGSSPGRLLVGEIEIDWH